MSEVPLHSVEPTAAVRLGLWANCIRLSQKKQHRLLVPRPWEYNVITAECETPADPTDLNQHGLMDMLMSHSVPPGFAWLQFPLVSGVDLIMSESLLSKGGGFSLKLCAPHTLSKRQKFFSAARKAMGVRGWLAEVVCRRKRPPLALLLHDLHEQEAPKASSMIQYLQGRDDQSH